MSQRPAAALPAPTFQTIGEVKEHGSIRPEVAVGHFAPKRTVGCTTLHEPREFLPDPPDCVCLNDAGEPVAIEVAEVVCEEAARLNAQGCNVYRYWRPGDLAAHVSRALAEKDAKTFHGGPYSSIIACLFTDEPALTVEQAESELAAEEFGPFAQITNAYLLFSYRPATQSYPVIPLRIRQ